MNYDIEQLLWTKREDHRLFQDWTTGLPVAPAGWPGGLGAHSISCLRMIQKLAQIDSLLEIGMNLGRSAVMWLNLGVRQLVSVDISPSELVHQAGTSLANRYPNRFQFFITTAADRDNRIRGIGKIFDAIFIDGGHEYVDVKTDIELARSLGIQTMIFDDHHPHFGPGVRQAIAEARLKTLAVFGNIAYCEEQSPDIYGPL